MLQRCLDCGRHRFPAARYCTQCRGERSEWVATSGSGVVESYCTFHRAYWPAFAPDVPYDVVQVKLDEGVRLFSNLVGVPRERIRVRHAGARELRAGDARGNAREVRTRRMKESR